MTRRAGRPAGQWVERLAGRKGTPEINLRLDGFGFATGRSSDQFRKASRTADERVYDARVALVKRLHEDDFDDLLDALMRNSFSWRVLERADRDGRPGLRSLRQSLHRIPLDKVLEQFRIAYARANTPKVMKHLQDFAVYARGHLGRAPVVTDLTRRLCVAYLDQLTIKAEKTRRFGEPVSPATRNRYRASLSLLASWCLEREWIDAHPITAKRVRRSPERRKTIPVVQPEQIRRYRAAALAYGDPLRATFLWCLLATGADINEVRLLRLSDIIWGADATPTRIVFRRSKTSTRERAVPIADGHFVERLQLVCAPFGDQLDGQPFAHVTDKALWTVHTRARHAASALTLTIKQLRHVAAQLWRYAGADLETVREWLGHSTLAQTQIYANFGQVDGVDLPIAQAVAQLVGSETTVADITRARLKKRARLSNPNSRTGSGA